MERYGWIGLGILVVGTLLFALGVPLMLVWFTPIMWTGYILLVDALVFTLTGSSLLTTRREELWIMLPAGIGWWLMFEVYNVYLENWHYIGGPENYLVRVLGYAWAYATIFPGIFVTADLLLALRMGDVFRGRPFAVSPEFLWWAGVTGAVFVVLPLLIPPPLSWYMFGFVWIGFILLLEPLLYTCGAPSLLRYVLRGQWGVLLAYVTAGGLCGLLWEWWNYWAMSKWVYTVPLGGWFHIFEMPELGFLGFLPFALECFALYHFTRLLLDWRTLRLGQARMVVGVFWILLLVVGLRFIAQPTGWSVPWPRPAPQSVPPLIMLNQQPQVDDLRLALGLVRDPRAPEFLALSLYPPHDPAWHSMRDLLRDPDRDVRRRAALAFRYMARQQRLAPLRSAPDVALE